MILLSKTEKLSKQFEKVELILFDLQGTLLPVDKNENEEFTRNLVEALKNFVAFCGLYDLKVGLISGSVENELTKAIEEIEDCEFLHSSVDKVTQAKKLLEKFKINFDNVFFVGDELFDLPLLRLVGISCAPNDARREVKRGAAYILEVPGGIEVLDYLQKVIPVYRTQVKEEKRGFFKRLFN